LTDKNLILRQKIIDQKWKKKLKEVDLTVVQQEVDYRGRLRDKDVSSCCMAMEVVSP
jgi:hypothetical protein